jgi:chromosome segregation ATPase
VPPLRRSRLRELERELRLIGPINPFALEEFNELQTRHDVPGGAARGRPVDAS